MAQPNSYDTLDDSIPINIIPPDTVSLTIELSNDLGSSPLPVNWVNHSSPFFPHPDFSIHAPDSPPFPQISPTPYGETHGDDVYLSQPIPTIPWNDSLSLILSQCEQFDRPHSLLEPTSITTSLNGLTLSPPSPTFPAVHPAPKVFDRTFSPSFSRTPNPYYNDPTFDVSGFTNEISASSGPQIGPPQLFVDTDIPSPSILPSPQPSHSGAPYYYNPHSPSIAHLTPSPASTPSPYSPSSVSSVPSPYSGSGRALEGSYSEGVCSESDGGTHQPSHLAHPSSSPAYPVQRPVLGRRSHSEGRSHMDPGMPCRPPQSNQGAMANDSSTSTAVPNFPNPTNLQQHANNQTLSPDTERFPASRGRGPRRPSTSTPGSRMASPYVRRDGSSLPDSSDPRASPERPSSHRASKSESSSFLTVPDFLESWRGGGLSRRHSHSGSRPDMRPDSDTTHSSLGSLAGRRRSATDHSHLDQFRQGLMFESQGLSSRSTPAEDQSSYDSAYDQQSIRAKVTSDATLEASTSRRKNAATFICHICGNQLTAKHNLDRHIRAHMGKRPFKCPCGQSFTSKSDCTRHQRNSQQSSCIAEQPSSQEIPNPDMSD